LLALSGLVETVVYMLLSLHSVTDMLLYMGRIAEVLEGSGSLFLIQLDPCTGDSCLCPDHPAWEA